MKMEWQGNSGDDGVDLFLGRYCEHSEDKRAYSVVSDVYAQYVQFTHDEGYVDNFAEKW